MVGKWHLGMKEADHPLRHGFDEFFGPLDTDHPYFGETSGNPILRGTTPVPATGHLTDTLAAEAAGFIRRRAGQPFFLYVPFTAIHTPLQARPDLYARLSYIANPRRAAGSGGPSWARRGRGPDLAELHATGVAERTAIVFLGDNGCASCERQASSRRQGDLVGGRHPRPVPPVMAWRRAVRDHL